MKLVSILVAAALAGAAIAMPSTGGHAAPPRVEAQSCDALAAQYGPAAVWSAWFRGSQRDVFDRITSTSGTGCFTSLANCQAWLYWMQSDWPYRNTFRPCRRGLD